MYWEASASHHFFTTNRGITAIRKSIYRPCYCFRAQICKYTYFSIVISNVFINSTKYEICIEWPYIIPSCLLCPVFPSLLKSKYSRYSTLFITQYGAGDELQHHQHFGLADLRWHCEKKQFTYMYTTRLISIESKDYIVFKIKGCYIIQIILVEF